MVEIDIVIKDRQCRSRYVNFNNTEFRLGYTYGDLEDWIMLTLYAENPHPSLKFPIIFSCYCDKDLLKKVKIYKSDIIIEELIISNLYYGQIITYKIELAESKKDESRSIDNYS